MATVKFTEVFATANANQTVKFKYMKEESVGVIIGYSDDIILVQTDSRHAWALEEDDMKSDGITITSKEPLEYNTRVLFIAYEDITEIIEDNPVVMEAESIAKKEVNNVLFACFAALFILILLFCTSNSASAQVSVSKENTEVLASVRLGNAKIMQHEAQYAITMTDKTNSGAKSRLQIHGYSFDSGIVVLVLGNKETAIGVLEYLANNKPAKGEEVTIAGNEGTVITYSGLMGGWQFHQQGMVGNLSQGEAKRFLKAINK